MWWSPDQSFFFFIETTQHVVFHSYFMLCWFHKDLSMHFAWIKKDHSDLGILFLFSYSQKHLINSVAMQYCNSKSLRRQFSPVATVAFATVITMDMVLNTISIVYDNRSLWNRLLLTKIKNLKKMKFSIVQLHQCNCSCVTTVAFALQQSWSWLQWWYIVLP